MRVLVTGASGFVGRHVVAELRRRSITTRIVRREHAEAASVGDGVEVVSLSGPGNSAIDWVAAVSGCDVVIHLAARAHVLRDAHIDAESAFQLANVVFARACCEEAARAGVRRFIFMSSIGVHGGDSGEKPIQLESPIKPHTLYARSKAKAEQALKEVSVGTRMELTVLRAPLVYGLGAPGNFGALVRAVRYGWPLPFGKATHNLRSFAAVDNLVDLIVTCLDHPAAANQTFLVSDGEDLSTADLLCRLGAAMGRPARLLPVPVSWLASGARLFRKQEMFQSLFGSLQVDISQTRERLGWGPPIGVDEGLKRAVRGTLC